VNVAFEHGDYPGYVSAAERRRRIAAALRDLERRGIQPAPIAIEGRDIATTFWGRAWCRHVEGLADLATRLPRGRSYVRSGAVVDLRIEPGAVHARVCGTELYDATVRIRRLPHARWAAVRRAATGQIANLVDLLAGELPEAVLQVLSDRDHGVLPRRGEIELECTCPDHARLCKHLAAVLYGIGARLDREPELLFVLRGVDPAELVAAAGAAASRVASSAPGEAALPREALGEIFGIELEPASATVDPKGSAAAGTARKRTKRTVPAGGARWPRRRSRVPPTTPR
jgi:uncharacterized Zn finger protein